MRTRCTRQRHRPRKRGSPTRTGCAPSGGHGIVLCPASRWPSRFAQDVRASCCPSRDCGSMEREREIPHICAHRDGAPTARIRTTFRMLDRRGGRRVLAPSERDVRACGESGIPSESCRRATINPAQVPIAPPLCALIICCKLGDSHNNHWSKDLRATVTGGGLRAVERRPRPALGR